MPELVLTGGRVLVGDAEVAQDLHLRDGHVAAPPGGASEAERIDVRGLLLAPGFVDLQCNGGLGVDVTSEPERLWELGAALPRWGVTAWLPTVVTAPRGAIDRALAALAAGPPPGWRGARPLGLHLEGPFLAPEARGAHPAEHLQAPTAAAVAGWTRTAGVAVVTLAPELPGALDVIDRLVDAGVVVSLGHSRATAAEATAAVDAGATWVTHLFNAMAGLHHREPGLVGVALDDERLHVGAIADGEHLAPPTLRLAARLLGPRLTLVTDAVAPLGEAAPEAAARTPSGVLAGATCPMDAAVRNLVRWAGRSPVEALAAASAAPAAVLRDTERGTLAPGGRADVVALTPDLEVAATWVGGELVYDAR